MADGANGGAFMKITILVEGKTEKTFKPYLLDFLKHRLSGRMPAFDFFPYNSQKRL